MSEELQAHSLIQGSPHGQGISLTTWPQLSWDIQPCDQAYNHLEYSLYCFALWMASASTRCQQRIPPQASPWSSFYVIIRIHWLVLTHHVCHLHKSIYNLNQAPWAWFIELKTFIQSSGFLASHSYSSIFIHSHNSILVYFLVYVNNLLYIGNSLLYPPCYYGPLQLVLNQRP